MRILAIHGIGHCDAKTDWQASWTSTITKGLQDWNDEIVPDIQYLRYDDFFEKQELGSAVVARALAELTASGLFFGLRDLVIGRRGMLSDALESVRWTAGMVAQWVALEGLRDQLRRHLSKAIRETQPHVIAAHSLGTLLLYDTLRSDEVATAKSPLSADRTVITFGSQIGNPAVRRIFGGRVPPLEDARFWWHLFNAEDEVFTCALPMPEQERFRQVDTLFDVKGIDHDGALYLGHEGTVTTVWQDVASRVTKASARSLRAPVPTTGAVPTSKATALSAKIKRARKVRETERKRKPRARALLVGIADYPDPANVLEGPVNDVFSMSAALQELGFDADDIRIVLNDRATTEGIRERLKWLLSDPGEGDQLVFFFAGHGAQIPGYGSSAEVDRVDECLVPYDFDWSHGRAITDDEFAALYGQLPYGTQFTAVLDCCHSGGMVRAGGVRARGITPPDDIRHRSIRWDKDTQMWLPRERLEAKKGRGRGLKRAADKKAWVGESGAVKRLGRGTALWLRSDAAYRRAAERNGHQGPYTPILLEACNENELAYEYRHGVVSQGAFTFALCGTLRDAVRRRDEDIRAKRKPQPMTFAALRKEVAKRVKSVVSEPQSPQLNCAKSRRRDPIPGLA